MSEVADSVASMTIEQLDRRKVQLKRKLSPKQKKWMEQLPLSNYQEWSAAKALGFSSATVSSWLRKPNVVEYIEVTRELSRRQMDFNELSLLLGYVREEQADMRRLFNENGVMKPPHEWPEDVARCVIEYGFDQNGNPKVKLADQRGARDRLAKYLRMKMFVDRHEVTGKDGAPLSGGALVVPAVIREDDWEKMLKTQQDELARREERAAGVASPS